jgi:hypothetical protein
MCTSGLGPTWPEPTEDVVKGRRGIDRPRKKRRAVVMLEEELDAWLERADPSDAVRVLAGGPGAGKSSFALCLTKGHGH